MLLTRYGRREWLLATIAATPALTGFAAMGWWWAAAATGASWLGVASFFRDPARRAPADLEPGAMLSPADGRVTAVERVDHHPAADGPAVVIRIFLSILNVHVNRSPCRGQVREIDYTPGRFHDARSPESARENESNLITMRLAGNESIGVRQVAGKIARRIVCAVRVGDRLARGQRFGMIKFGSTTELILPRPDDVEVHVKVGDRVKGGLTCLATVSFLR